jgi:hypothetical protein
MKACSLLQWAVATLLTTISATRALTENVAVEVPRAASINYNTPSANYVPLRKATKSPSNRSLQQLKRSQAADSDDRPMKDGIIDLRNANNIYYLVDITVGNQTIPVYIDTGSSDTWIVQQPLECVDFAYFPRPVGPNQPDGEHHFFDKYANHILGVRLWFP